MIILHVHAQEALLKSFEDEQLSMHTAEPVWKFRDHPPSEWVKPDPGAQTTPSHQEKPDNS